VTKSICSAAGYSAAAGSASASGSIMAFATGKKTEAIGNDMKVLRFMESI
jgi:hypothetical protein